MLEQRVGNQKGLKDIGFPSTDSVEGANIQGCFCIFIM